ncbi:MAG TPA: HEAT repeat domain-containing protein [Steroidobacteraceae bacterium]|nr:HEAT repeat domain-containing protein [Steroidobacteraceae bacterium]
MKFLASLRGEKLLADIKAGGEPSNPARRKAIEKLVALGKDAVPMIVDALGSADKGATMAFVEVLSTLANDPKNVPVILEGLAESNPRTTAAIAWALSSAKTIPPGLLLDALKNPDLAGPALIDVINAHKTRIPLRDLLSAAYAHESGDKAALFKIIGDVADEASIPDLLARLDGKDFIVRINLMDILARFGTPEVQQALVAQLKDPSKLVRQAALAALLKTPSLPDVKPVAPLLADSDMEVTNRAIELMIKAHHPQTVRYLIPILKDESEYARRAAVEVLNEVGDAGSIKILLEAIKDSDWWVRSRAADALGKIGGPRVVDAVLLLVRDPDEDIRRTAIEILNLTKDERAVDYLLQATRDTDWWVSERAVDALAEIGSERAVPRLIEMLKGPARSVPSAIRALSKLGDASIIEALVPQLARPEKEIRVETMHALATLTDERNADTIRTKIRSIGEVSTDQTVVVAANRALENLDARFSTAEVAAQKRAEHVAAAPARTMLIENADLHELVKQNEAAAQRLDITTLKAGDILDGRYKYIEKIGKGAFGTVLLMEDTVVDERLILKFLNPAVSQDEEMMQRFVHELRYSRKITHRNVIRIYDFLFIRGNYAISMEYFPSHTLGAEIVNEKPLAVPRAVKYGIDIATGMSVAHEIGIVHRDLKPANVLINDQGLLKIVDFGVAAAQREGDVQLTKTGYVIGSPKYMAPEQILGKQVDPRADVYSTGVILYEMLTGVPPYSRGDHMAVMYQHVQGKARPPLEVNSQLPPALSDLVTKAMAVDKTKRFQSMDELRVALEKFA